MKSVRSLCRWPDSEGDPNPTNLLIDLDPKSTWVYEDRGPGTREWRVGSSGSAKRWLGDTGRKVFVNIVSKNKEEVKFYLNVICGLIHAHLYGLYVCWSHVTYRHQGVSEAPWVSHTHTHTHSGWLCLPSLICFQSIIAHLCYLRACTDCIIWFLLNPHKTEEWLRKNPA